jgi:hypothetical protein
MTKIYILEYKKIILLALLFVGMFFVCGCNFDEKYSAEIYPANGTEFDSIEDFYCYVVVKEHKKARFLFIIPVPALDETKEMEESLVYNMISTHPLKIIGSTKNYDSEYPSCSRNSGEANKLRLTTDTSISNDKRIHISLSYYGMNVGSPYTDYYIKKQYS